MWRQHSGLVSRRLLLLGSRRGGRYAQALVVPTRHHGTPSSSSSLTRLLLGRETASTTTQKGEAWKWYACGPTVYDSAHLGHARTYVCQDIIRRVLTDYFRQDVMFVMGVTDVDDKILRRATERYERRGGGRVVGMGGVDLGFLSNTLSMAIFISFPPFSFPSPHKYAAKRTPVS